MDWLIISAIIAAIVAYVVLYRARAERSAADAVAEVARVNALDAAERRAEAQMRRRRDRLMAWGNAKGAGK